MTDGEFTAKLDELDQLLNDPDVPMQPARVWALLAEVSHRDLGAPTPTHAPAAATPSLQA